MTQIHEITVMRDNEGSQFILQGDMPYLIMDRLEAKGLAHKPDLANGGDTVIGEVWYSGDSIEKYELRDKYE